VWHFAFHLIPELPETLVAGRERPYFDFFFDFLSGRKDALSDEIRERLTDAYRTPAALKTGFDWYRAMPEDAKHNEVPTVIETPILYVRGDADQRPMEPYLNGFRKAGVRNLRTGTVKGAGEFLAHEAPDPLIALLGEFASAGLKVELERA
jgi:pimeloyl-ACP methyl ester carboxylesterase